MLLFSQVCAFTAQTVRKHIARKHPQRSVFFHTIGNEISYRIKKAACIPQCTPLPVPQYSSLKKLLFVVSVFQFGRSCRNLFLLDIGRRLLIAGEFIGIIPSAAGHGT